MSPRRPHTSVCTSVCFPCSLLTALRAGPEWGELACLPGAVSEVPAGVGSRVRWLRAHALGPDTTAVLAVGKTACPSSLGAEVTSCRPRSLHLPPYVSNTDRAHTSSPNPAACAKEQIWRVSCPAGAGRSGQFRRLGHEEAPEEGRVRVTLGRSAVSDLDVLLVDMLVGPEAGRMADF